MRNGRALRAQQDGHVRATSSCRTCIRRRWQQLARRARRAEGALPRRQRSSSRAGARRTCLRCEWTSRIGTATYAWRPAAVRHYDDNGSSSRATGAESKRERWACARHRQGASPCSPRSEGLSRSATCAASRANAVRHNDDNGERRRRRRRRQLALEGRGGSSPRTRSCDGSSSARLLTGGQRARRASQ